jgi:hypothetical protein
VPEWGRKKWSGRRDLNPRLPPRQGGALPLSYARSFSALVIIARCKPIVESNRRCSEREGEAPAEPNSSASREMGKSAGRKGWAHREVRPPIGSLGSISEHTQGNPLQKATSPLFELRVGQQHAFTDYAPLRFLFVGRFCRKFSASCASS